MSEVDDDTIHVEPEPVVKPVLKSIVDVDATWDGKGSLDEHRQQQFAKITQPGFGDAGKVKTDGE
jgi:hypothetical protein